MGFSKYLKIRKGKFVLEKKKKESKPKIIEKTIYKYFPTMGGEIKIPTGKIFKYGICGDCGEKYYEREQKICEKCGFILPRL